MIKKITNSSPVEGLKFKSLPIIEQHTMEEKIEGSREIAKSYQVITIGHSTLFPEPIRFIKMEDPHKPHMVKAPERI
jgi:hypothetical protein